MGRLILFIYMGVANAVLGQGIDFPLKTDKAGRWEVISTQVYEGSGLWGYINGGADIFMEYGFQRVYAQEVISRGYHYKIDTYFMADPLAAFGIFSINRYSCAIDDSIQMPHCITPYHLSAVVGNHFISITHETAGDPVSREAIELLHALSKNLSEADISLPGPFNEKNHVSYVKCMRGKLGIMNGFPPLYELFEPWTDYTLFILPVPSPDAKSILAQVDFKDIHDRDAFAKHLIEWQEGDKKPVLQLMGSRHTDGAGLVFLLGKEDEMESLHPYISRFFP